MISKRTFALMTVVVMLLAGAIVGAVAGQDREEGVDLDEIQEEIIRDLFDKEGRMATTDDRLARIAQEYEGGFAGERATILDDCAYFRVRPPVGGYGIRVICVGLAIINDGKGWPSSGDMARPSSPPTTRT